MQIIPARDERFWNRLLKSIQEGQVVPVVGSQLLVWGESANPQTLQRLVAEQVLQSRGVDPSSLPLTRHRELSDAVSILKNEHKVNLQDLYGDVSDALDTVIAQHNFQVPEAIAQLLAISDFRLLVTLNVDDLLARALRTRCAVNEVIHSPYLPTSEAVDLAPDWLKRTGETNLLYLLGKAKSTPVFAIHDEDILEYAHNLLSRGSNVPIRFLGELQQRGLLLIGSNFPDWLSRFFIRLTNQTRLSDKKTRAWLVEEIANQPDLTLFLRSYSNQTEILSDLSPQEFIAELHARWLARHQSVAGTAPVSSGPDPRGTVFFISYSRATDLPAAEQLFKCLQEQGATENEIWFDRTTIEPGQDFQRRIFEGISTCQYFLPLISAGADQFYEKFFYQEWQAAIDRSRGIRGRDFIVPLIVDEDYEPQRYRKVPHEWSGHIDFGHAPSGVPDARLRQLLTRMIRAHRRLAQSQEAN